MKRVDVESFVDRARDAVTPRAALGKRNTELRVVEPFLSLLGWDVRSNAVTAAYETAVGVVDYGLCPGGRVGALVSVVGAESSLEPAGRDDLLAAMRAEDVDRGVYTNGRQYVLLAREEPTGTSTVEEVHLELDDLPDRVDALRALSYEAVDAATTAESSDLADGLADAEAEVVERVVDVVLESTDATAHTSPRTGFEADADGVDLREARSTIRPHARAFVTTLVDEFTPTDVSKTPSESATISESSDSTAESDDSTTESGTDAVEAAGRSVSADAREAVVAEDASVSTMAAANEAAGAADTEFVLRFFEDGRSVGAVGNPGADVALAQAARYLLDERGIGPRIQFPYTPVSDDCAFLNPEPVHPDGSRMTSAIDLGGVYVDTGAPLDVRRRAVEELASRGGLQVMFAGDWP